MNATLFSKIVAVAFIAVLLLATHPVAAQLVSHPALATTGEALNIQKGRFGESFVDAQFRARGFEVVNGSLGAQGIDRIAARRTADGALSEARIVEVKFLQDGLDFKLAMTNDGGQLSKTWIEPRLSKLIERHPDPSVRKLAQEVRDLIDAHPERVTRELHGVSIGANRYVVKNVNAAGEITGVTAEQRLTAALQMLAQRGVNPQTQQSAARHLAQFDQLQAMGREQPATANFSHAVADSDHVALSAAAPSTIVVENEAAARSAFQNIARSPGVAGAAVTFAIDEGFSAWNYYEGKSTTAEFQQETTRNAVKAAVVGTATQLVYVLAPAPGGLVIVAVGVVTYFVADFVLDKCDKAFTPGVVSAADLQGIVPNRFLGPPRFDSTTVGRQAAR